jgi:phage host-nuclease inhibitor protein Gam
MEAITTAMDTILSIIECETGFLVDGEYGGNAVEVARTEAGLECQCFIAQVSHDDCEHIRAVRDHIASVPMSLERPMLSQADADYYLSKLGELDNTIAANAESAEEQIKRINLWLELETDKIQQKKNYYVLALDNWMHLNEYSTKQLVAGTLKVRSQQPEIKINDETKVLMDERFVRIVPEKKAIDKTALRKYCMDTGEEIPGIEIMLKPHKFSYKLNTGGA